MIKIEETRNFVDWYNGAQLQRALLKRALLFVVYGNLNHFFYVSDYRNP